MIRPIGQPKTALMKGVNWDLQLMADGLNGWNDKWETIELIELGVRTSLELVYGDDTTEVELRCEAARYTS